MIQNKLFITSILVTATTAASFVGCGSNSSTDQGGGSGSGSGGPNSSSSSGSTGSDAGSSASGSGSSSGSSQSGDAGECMPPSSVPSSSVPPYVPVVGMTNACAPMQISGFVSSCVAQGATGSGCESWATSNGPCASCIVQGTDAGVTQTGAIVFNAMGAPVSGNIPGCIALEDTSGGPACAAQLEPLLQCVALSCSTCRDQTSFNDCEAAAKGTGGACAAYASAAQSPCATDLSSNGVGVTKCGYGTANELADVINVLCGTGP